MMDYKLKLTQIVLTNEDNPLKWDEESLQDRLNGDVVVGYLLRMRHESFIIALYSIKEKYLSNKEHILSLARLKNAFSQWLDSMQEDPFSILFKNPPIEQWLESKDNWLKKVSNNLAKTYNKPYDECLSELYYVIMTCYNKDTVYLGSLNYIVTTAHNALKKEYGHMKNKLTGANPMVISLDAHPSSSYESDDTAQTYHDILVGEDNPIHEALDFEETTNAIITDMNETFSAREIDQILNRPGPLPETLYRKLLKWRKSRSMEDYK